MCVVQMWAMSSPATAHQPDAPRPLPRPHCWRHKPDDFREQYILQGWETICWHYRANWKTVRRWIDEEGREDLKAARALHVRTVGNQRLHRVDSRRRQR